MIKKYKGTLFLVVGNSGSGKDSIIQGALESYPSQIKRLYAPKRYITRPPSETENNISVSPEEFKFLSQEGKFAIEWHIYGLDYGVPIEIDDLLRKGHPVAINVSRKIVPKTREIYENIKVIFIEVPFEITLKRLRERARESGKRLNERIERAKNNQHYPEADYSINNTGQLNDAIEKFINYIMS
ncbi:MAG: phosphonate metabolism protein/1,5-bisphosphokinase (PRPP-forming) PhnN, partial [Candidatus Thorarchaeota archaeon]